MAHLADSQLDKIIEEVNFHSKLVTIHFLGKCRKHSERLYCGSRRSWENKFGRFLNFWHRFNLGFDFFLIGGCWILFSSICGKTTLHGQSWGRANARHHNEVKRNFVALSADNYQLDRQSGPRRFRRRSSLCAKFGRYRHIGCRCGTLLRFFIL